MFQKLKMASVALAILIFLLSLLAVLQFYRFQHLLFEVNSSRISAPAQMLKRDVERTLAFGLSLQLNVQLKSMLEQVIEKYPSIQSVQIVDTVVDSGKVLWDTGDPVTNPMQYVRAQIRSGKEMWFDASHPSFFIQSWTINDPIGQPVASLSVAADKSQAVELLADARIQLLKFWLLLCLAVLIILTPILLYIFTRLDRIIDAAKDILLGKTVNSSLSDRSEVCALSQQIVNTSQAQIVDKG
jgi:hypothetical protein